MDSIDEELKLLVLNQFKKKTEENILVSILVINLLLYTITVILQ